MRLLVLNARSTSDQLTGQLQILNNRETMRSWSATASFEATTLGMFAIYVNAAADHHAYMAKGFVLGAFFGLVRRS